MAHNLAFDVTAGRHAMFSGDRKAAWHNLGVVVDGALNWQDAMQEGKEGRVPEAPGREKGKAGHIQIG